MAKRPKSNPTPGRASPPRWESSSLTYLAGRSHLDQADALALAMESKWGAGRLRLLVAPDLRERFDRQRLKLNEAIRDGEVADVQREAARMVNAWQALDRAAEASGATPLSPEVWELTLDDGRVVALCRTPHSALAVARGAMGRHVEVWTLDEVGKLISGFPTVSKAKEVFPGATVDKVRNPYDDPLEAMERVDLNDAIPF